MVEKCSYQGMKLRDDIALWNSRLCCGVVSEEQQKLPNLLLHAIFQIDEIAVNGPNDRSPYRRDSRSSVYPRQGNPPLFPLSVSKTPEPEALADSTVRIRR